MLDIGNMKNIRIGEVLVSQGYITEAQLEQALAFQQQSPGRRLGDLLVDLGMVTEQQKLQALATRLSMRLIRIDAYPVKVEAVRKIPRALAEKYLLIAIDLQNGQLAVAVNDPLNFFAIEEVRQIVKLPVSLALAEAEQIHHAIEYYYAEISTMKAVSDANQAAPIAPVTITEMVGEGTDDAPVVRLLNSLLIKGFNTNASDIHVEPFADFVSVRIRVDGTIVDYTQLSLSVHQALIARIKILADLDIAEKRIPQDGHFRLQNEGMDLNIRVSLVPTVYGEKAVLRFLSTNSLIDHNTTFGMQPENYEKMMKALNSPHGIIYLTGPTGSGKTTTLYMMLEYLAQRQVNIVTIEDPVERNIRRCNQVQVNNTVGVTFDAGLRAVLRQDPDIIMVGETRDAETAATSIRAAITGHLVLSTLHTNDAVSSIVRLADMGVPSYLISNSLVALVAQRLVRKVCRECAYTYEISDSERILLGREARYLSRGRGCPKCNGTGYRGRIAVHEILLIDKTLRRMIIQDAGSDEIFAYARQSQNMRTLREAATDLVLGGVTSVDELLKTAYYEEM